MHKTRRLIKNLLAYALYYSGILFLIKHFKLKNRTIVLLFHRVIPDQFVGDSFSHDAIIISDKKFTELLVFLKSHFKILCIDEFTSYINDRKPLPNESCLITFDDGWLDNYQFALPILNKYKVPAVIFLPVDFIDSDNLFWQESLGHILNQCITRNNQSTLELLKQHKLDYLVNKSISEQRLHINQYVRSLKSLEYDVLDQLIEKARAALGSVDYGNTDRYLGSEEIKALQQAGVISFGSHACSHRILTRLSKQQLEAELIHSKDQLQKLTQKQIDTIAYPNGDHNDMVCQTTADVGYKIAFTTEFGYASNEGDPLRINRINVNNATCMNRPVLLATLLGIFS